MRNLRADHHDRTALASAGLLPIEEVDRLWSAYEAEVREGRHARTFREFVAKSGRLTKVSGSDSTVGARLDTAWALGDPTPGAEEEWETIELSPDSATAAMMSVVDAGTAPPLRGSQADPATATASGSHVWDGSTTGVALTTADSSASQNEADVATVDEPGGILVIKPPEDDHASTDGASTGERADAPVAGSVARKMGFRDVAVGREPAALARPGTRGGDGRIGRFHLIGRIGRGGMGDVLEARDADLNREVALKVLLSGPQAKRAQIEKFLVEAQVTGQLEHPNIVPVHELGLTADGRVFFAMKYVRGRSLQAILHEHRRRAAGASGRDDSIADYTLTDLLDIYLKVCDAVGFAHAKGVVHRDLKPENVMVGDYGEVMVMDWGLATVRGRRDRLGEGVRVNLTGGGRVTGKIEGLHEAGSATRTLEGAILGTPTFMPPEQARGAIGEIDQRSDIYSLGAILYQVLTLTIPHQGSTAYEVLMQVVKRPLEPPSQRAPDRRVPPELESLVMKAMARRKDARYGSVAELKADVRAFLEGRALSAVDYTALGHVRKWLGRNRARLIPVAVVLVVALGALVGILVDDAQSERLRARQAEAQAAANERTNVAAIDAANVRQEAAQIALDRDDFGGAIALLTEAKEIFDGVLGRDRDRVDAQYGSRIMQQRIDSTRRDQEQQQGESDRISRDAERASAAELRASRALSEGLFDEARAQVDIAIQARPSADLIALRERIRTQQRDAAFGDVLELIRARLATSGTHATAFADAIAKARSVTGRVQGERGLTEVSRAESVAEHLEAARVSLRKAIVSAEVARDFVSGVLAPPGHDQTLEQIAREVILRWISVHIDGARLELLKAVVHGQGLDQTVPDFAGAIDQIDEALAVAGAAGADQTIAEQRAPLLELRAQVVSAKSMFDDVRDLVRQANDHYHNGRFATARQRYDEALAFVPDDADIRRERNNAAREELLAAAGEFQAQRRFARALTSLDDAMAFAGTDGEASDVRFRQAELLSRAERELIDRAVRTINDHAVRPRSPTSGERGDDRQELRDALDGLRTVVQLHDRTRSDPVGRQEVRARIDTLAHELAARLATPAHFLYIRGGEVRLGRDRPADEHLLQRVRNPDRTVALAPFAMSRLEVTVEAFGLFLAAGGYRDPQWWSDAGWAFARSLSSAEPLDWASQRGRPRHPVYGVSLYEAEAYARWRTSEAASARDGRPVRSADLGQAVLHFRVPTDGQWEHVARHRPQELDATRARSTRLFPWGDAFEDGNYSGDATDLALHPVGTHSQDESAFGVLDLAGNVMEWVRVDDADDNSREGGHPGWRGARLGDGVELRERRMRTWFRHRPVGGSPPPGDPRIRTTRAGFRLVCEVVVTDPLEAGEADAPGAQGEAPPSEGAPGTVPE